MLNCVEQGTNVTQDYTQVKSRKINMTKSHDMSMIHTHSTKQYFAASITNKKKHEKIIQEQKKWN